MTEANSPYFAQGLADGQADTDALQQCPPGEIQGMNVDMDWSRMYQRGYERTFDPTPHQCDPSCPNYERNARAV